MAEAVPSNVDYNTFLKLVASQNGGPLPDLNSFYEYVLSQPRGAEDLAKLAAVTLPTLAATGANLSAGATPVTVADTPAFAQSTSANGSVINLWFYQRVYINALGKQCTINMGGITPGFPGGATFGTLYYDNQADLSGDCDVAFTGFGPYYALYFRRNGGTFATYQSGNVGWSTGVAGGTGSWD